MTKQIQLSRGMSSSERQSNFSVPRTDLFISWRQVHKLCPEPHSFCSTKKRYDGFFITASTRTRPSCRLVTLASGSNGSELTQTARLHLWYWSELAFGVSVIAAASTHGLASRCFPRATSIEAMHPIPRSPHPPPECGGWMPTICKPRKVFLTKDHRDKAPHQRG